MKKILFLLLIPSLAFGAAQITLKQAQTVQIVTQNVNIDNKQLQALSAFLVQVTNNGGSFMLPGSTVPYVLSASQNNDYVNIYEGIKSDLCNVQCAALP